MFLRKYAEFPPFLPPRISPKKIAGRNKKKKEKNSIRGKRVKSRKNIHFSLFSPAGWLFPFFLLQANTSMPTFSFFPQKKLWKGRKNHPGKIKRIFQASFPQVVIHDFVLSCLAQSSTFGEGGGHNFGRLGVALLFLSSFWEEKGKISLTDPLRPGAPKRGGREIPKTTTQWNFPQTA